MLDWWRRRKKKQVELAELERKAADAFAHVDECTEKQREITNGHVFDRVPVDTEIEGAAEDAVAILEGSLTHGRA